MCGIVVDFGDLWGVLVYCVVFVGIVVKIDVLVVCVVVVY